MLKVAGGGPEFVQQMSVWRPAVWAWHQALGLPLFLMGHHFSPLSSSRLCLLRQFFCGLLAFDLTWGNNEPFVFVVWHVDFWSCSFERSKDNGRLSAFFFFFSSPPLLFLEGIWSDSLVTRRGNLWNWKPFFFKERTTKPNSVFYFKDLSWSVLGIFKSMFL